MTGDDDPEADLDALEERAAIIAEGEGITPWLAEQVAAKGQGYSSWARAQLAIKRRIRQKKAGD